ncbi:MAG: malate synthase G [Pseudomonadota bacterium]
MSNRIEHSGLSIDADLFSVINDEIMPGTGLDADMFWDGLAAIVTEMGGRNADLLKKRDDIQIKLDRWHKEHGSSYTMDDYRTFLQDIGYLVEEGEDFQISTQNVDDEIATIAGPQLVVPVDNARYALNAANARWNSLYDALYGTDVILEVEGCKKTSKYNPVRGVKVIQYAREFLDKAVPLAVGSHSYAVRYVVRNGKLVVIMGDGSKTELGHRGRFAGYKGDPENPDSILLKHHNLHIEIKIGEGYFIGQGDLANIYDVVVESAVTTIMDCEDSVAAVDAEDKIRVYRNWAGLMKGDLSTTLKKGDRTIERVLDSDLDFLSPKGEPMTLHGRCLMFVRNVGPHMYTDAVTKDGNDIPETFLDAMVTVMAAMHDLQKTDGIRNSRKGSVYVVKPKMHGPQEVAEAVAMFGKVEKILGLPANTVKIGIMDEERRTTVNLKECIRQAKDRLVFINTGFLDRTGDEIHTCMEAGPVLPKNDIKSTPWLLAYEDWNVDVGLAAGLRGKAQIGKGMWAAPDNMAAMIEQKIGHPRSGANTAWVPSPIAATLHSLHYHYVNVQTCQEEIAQVARADLNDILTIPTLNRRELTAKEIDSDLENNVQGILGYVVRWIDQGVGCSKVPDISDTELMEDRATLRISSQHIANWLHHGLVTEEQIHQAFQRMASIVDIQNSKDPSYQPMAPDFDGVAYKAALDLVFKGRETANGYTESVLHARRREAKSQA